MDLAGVKLILKPYSKCSSSCRFLLQRRAVERGEFSARDKLWVRLVSARVGGLGLLQDCGDTAA